jgi:hypothetical protein
MVFPKITRRKIFTLVSGSSILTAATAVIATRIKRDTAPPTGILFSDSQAGGVKLEHADPCVQAGTVNQAKSGGIVYPQTLVEAAAGVTPTSYVIPSHLTAGGVFLERYGGGNAAGNDASFAKALLVAGQLDLPIFISAGREWQFSAPWVMTGTGQRLGGMGAPAGGVGVTGCRVIGIGGRPIIQFTRIGAGVDCITLGGSKLPQVEFRNLHINCNTTGRDGLVILGSNLPIIDNVIIENSTRDSFVLSPNGTSSQWIEKGRFGLQIRFAGRHGVMMSLLGTANPYINECVWDLLEVRGVSVVTAGGNAIAMTAVGGLGRAAKISDHNFIKTVFDCIYTGSGKVPSVNVVEAYSGLIQNFLFQQHAWENTSAVSPGAGYSVSVNRGGGATWSGLTMIAGITNSFWGSNGIDPGISQITNFDYSFAKIQLAGSVSNLLPTAGVPGYSVSGNTTSKSTADFTATRSGAANASIGQGPTLNLANSTSGTQLNIQEYNGNTIIFGFFSGAWKELVRITTNGGVQLNQKSNVSSGTGAPTGGVSGDYYYRQDTPGTANQRIYVNNAGVWTGIL